MGALKNKKEIIIHAHFYQPQRNNPQTGELYEETNKMFYKSYNDIIIDECYGPLSLKKLKYKDELVSVYSKISFNFGPTLLNYIEKNYPKLYSSIIEADIVSSKIYQRPSAIAQVYNHSILPLLNLTKKKLYIGWGIENFEKHFKRKPLGMWLSETSVDEDTLDALIEKGIRFTILSPSQVIKIKNIENGEEKTISNYEDLDTSLPYIWKSKRQNGEIKIFFYNKSLSDKLNEISNPEKYYLRLKLSFDGSKDEHIIIASDGENYGHYIKNGDEYLLKLIKLIENEKTINLNNLNSIFERPTKWAVDIKSPSSWSCPHGVGRWSRDCGCRINPSNNYQKWRKTLRQTVDEAEKKIDERFLFESSSIFLKPFDVLEKYINIYEEDSTHSTISFIEKNSIRRLTPQEIKKIVKLLVAEVEIALANASCGWFFDDILNIETLYSIKRMMRALELGGIELKPYLEKLKNEKSNYKADVKGKIEEIERKLLNSDKITACEFALFDKLNFLNPFYKNDYHPRIIKKENDTYMVKTIHIKTLEENCFNVRITIEKNNILFKLTKISDDQTAQKDDVSPDIFTLDDLSGEVRELVKILTSDSKNTTDIKEFFLLISKSSFSKQEISKIESKLISILNNSNLQKIPYLRDIILFIVKSKPDTELFKILDEKGIKLLWKKGIISYDYQENNT